MKTHLLKKHITTQENVVDKKTLIGSYVVPKGRCLKLSEARPSQIRLAHKYTETVSIANDAVDHQFTLDGDIVPLPSKFASDDPSTAADNEDGMNVIAYAETASNGDYGRIPVDTITYPNQVTVIVDGSGDFGADYTPGTGSEDVDFTIYFTFKSGNLALARAVPGDTSGRNEDNVLESSIKRLHQMNQLHAGSPLTFDPNLFLDQDFQLRLYLNSALKISWEDDADKIIQLEIAVGIENRSTVEALLSQRLGRSVDLKDLLVADISGVTA